jgi:hypothetical protein
MVLTTHLDTFLCTSSLLMLDNGARAHSTILEPFLRFT